MSRRTARVLTVHALLTLAVLCATIGVLALFGQTGLECAHDECWPAWLRVRLAATAPLWGLIAWHALVLRRLDLPRGLGVAAIAAIVAGLAAIATDLVAVPDALGTLRDEEAPRIAAIVELLAAGVWLIASARALGRVAGRLAASPFALAERYERARASWVAGAFAMQPMILAAASGFAAFLHPAAGGSIGASVVVWFAYNQLMLARLLAASRDLPEASAASRLRVRMRSGCASSRGPIDR
ncbi:MAG: hypothetical protein K8W52_13560 [Deltaproteobacteria bacterium]|nr:hypothetical protein [Deltaproteobacteria bacterium]